MKARENPFAVDRVHAIRYRPLNTTWDTLLVRLDDLKGRAAINGPEGSGKTTLLEDLQRVLEREGRRTRLVFVNDAAPLDTPACLRLLAELAREEVLLLDGADLITRRCWSLIKHRTATHAAGLVVTSHRPGLLPSLLECTTTPGLLAEIVRELLPPGRTIPLAELARLHERRQGNLRACLRELYDLYAQDRSAGGRYGCSGGSASCRERA